MAVSKNAGAVGRLVQEFVDGISVRYIYSACIVTKTPDITILHDPWFTEGIYDGSWFHFPRIARPIEAIGNVDCIYVSHIHPDHYDSTFLKSYFKVYGIKKVLIANHSPNHLAGKMRADGILPTILDGPMLVGKTEIRIIPHQTGSISDIDSAIIIKYNSNLIKKIHCVVNANDIIFDDEMRDRIKKMAGDVDILLCGYTGAGPYPQTYFDILDPNLIIEANNKKKLFLERYTKLTKIMDAKINIPFAGKYLLGGRLSELNAYRGVSDPVEVLDIDDNALILSDNGLAEINTIDLIPTGIRTKRYDENEILERINQIKLFKMDYERLISISEINQLPIKRLLYSAVRNALAKSECNEDYFFCIQLPKNQYAIINANKNSTKPCIFIESCDELPIPRSELFIDPRYLFGLLTNIYHWNNAEVGSQYNTRRFPNILNRNAQTFLNYLTV